MNKILLSMMFGAVLTGAAATAFAQPPAGTIHERKEDQQDRIGKGVENGSLTPRETAHLEHKEAKINKEVRHDRKQNGGNLTDNEKKQINRQQNHASRAIYRDKHNGKTQ